MSYVTYKIAIDGVAYDREMIEKVEARLVWHADLDEVTVTDLIRVLVDSEYGEIQVLTCEYILGKHSFRDKARKKLERAVKGKIPSEMMTRMKDDRRMSQKKAILKKMDHLQTAIHLVLEDGEGKDECQKLLERLREKLGRDV